MRTLLLALCLAGCAQEGPEGPPGATGPAGPMGAMGAPGAGADGVDTFVSGTRIKVVRSYQVMTGTDGTVINVPTRSYVDTRWGLPCTLESLAGAAGTYCLPRGALSAGWFLDPACTQEVGLAPPTLKGNPPPVFCGYEGCWQTSSEVALPAKAYFVRGSCSAVDPVEWASHAKDRAFGVARLAPSDFVSFQTTTQ